MIQHTTRRQVLTTLLGGLAATAATPAWAQSTPSADAIERSLSAPSQGAPRQPIQLDEFKHQRGRRRRAPSIDIQSINFEFGSARIPPSQDWKIERIATALRRILRRDPNELFLVEGHTDAVGSRQANYALSNARAWSVIGKLRRYGVPSYALEGFGLGEDELLVPTQAPSWRNRRVTLRRITDYVVIN